MLKHIRRIIRYEQAGITLVELIVGIALFSVIMLGISLTFWQILTVTATSSNHIQAVKQIQNAGIWISRDGEQSQPEFVVTGVYDPALIEPQTVLRLGWYNMPLGTGAQTIKYVIYVTEKNNELKHELRRELNNDASNYIVVAEDIHGFEIPTSGSYFQLTITATVGKFRSASATGIYTFKLRPSNPLT